MKTDMPTALVIVAAILAAVLLIVTDNAVWVILLPLVIGAFV